MNAHSTMLRTVVAIGAALSTVAAIAAPGESGASLVLLDTEQNSFWHTATNELLSVPVDFPPGATSASLSVRGIGYSRDYADIQTNEFAFVLPTPNAPEEENVYSLTLAFDDGTVRTARLGLVQGLSPAGEGATRCLVPGEGRKWSKVRGCAVMPVPPEATALEVNGQAVDLAANPIWYALDGVPCGETVTVSMTVDGEAFTKNLVGAGGSAIIVR